MKIPTFKPGVYALKAIESKLIYIGSTKHLGQRKQLHLYSIRKGDVNRGCKSMVEAFNEGDYIEFEVLEFTDQYESREQFWIDFYKSHPEYKLVNVFDGERKKSKITPEFREKMSQIRKERWKDPIYRDKMIEVLRRGKQTQLNKKKVLNKSDELLETRQVLENFGKIFSVKPDMTLKTVRLFSEGAISSEAIEESVERSTTNSIPPDR